MRTIVDLTLEQVAGLDRLSRREQVSRAELLRRAVDAYLLTQNTQELASLPGFGAWKKKRLDGVSYQRKLRAEWEV